MLDIVTVVRAEGMFVGFAVCGMLTPGGGAKGSEFDGSSFLDKFVDTGELLYELGPRLPVDSCSLRASEGCETPCYKD